MSHHSVSGGDGDAALVGGGASAPGDPAGTDLSGGVSPTKTMGPENVDVLKAVVEFPSLNDVAAAVIRAEQECVEAFTSFGSSRDDAVIAMRDAARLEEMSGNKFVRAHQEAFRRFIAALSEARKLRAAEEKAKVRADRRAADAQALAVEVTRSRAHRDASKLVRHWPARVPNDGLSGGDELPQYPMAAGGSTGAGFSTAGTSTGAGAHGGVGGGAYATGGAAGGTYGAVLSGANAAAAAAAEAVAIARELSSPSKGGRGDGGGGRYNDARDHDGVEGAGRIGATTLAAAAASAAQTAAAAAATVEAERMFRDDLRFMLESMFLTMVGRLDNLDLRMTRLEQTVESVQSHTVPVQRRSPFLIVLGGKTPATSEEELVLATSEVYDRGRAEWLPSASLNAPRWRCGSTVVMNQLVVMGGVSSYSEDGPAMNLVEAYDPRNDLWETLPPMVADRADCAAAPMPLHVNPSHVKSQADGSGSRSGSGAGSGGDASALEAKGGDSSGARAGDSGGKHAETGGDAAATSAAAGNSTAGRGVLLPTDAAGESGTSIELEIRPERLFVIGGIRRTDAELPLASGEVFDPWTREWTRLPNMHTRRQACIAQCVGGRLLVAGGWDGNIVLSSMEAFDPNKSTWERLAPMSQRRWRCGSLVTDRGRLVVIGGSEGRYGPYLDTVESFDPATGEWEALPPLPRKTNVCAATMYSGRILCVTEREGAIYMLAPGATVWTTFPIPLGQPRDNCVAAVINGLR